MADLWHTTWAAKKEMFGRFGLLPVGGRAPGDEEPASDPEEPGKAPPPRNATTREPVAWHALPVLFWQEILFDFKVGAVIDLTPSDGMLALAALQARVPYAGLVFSKKHADTLLDRLMSQVMAGATREGDAWYEPQLVEAITKTTPKPKSGAKDPKPKDPAAGKAKAKPKKGAKKANKEGKTKKGKGTGKKKKKKGDESDDDPFVSGEGSESESSSHDGSPDKEPE